MSGAATVVLLGLAASSTAGLSTYIESAIAGAERLPALRDVQEAAAEVADKAPDFAGGAARSRWRAWVPDIGFRIGTTQDVLVRDNSFEREWTRAGRDLGIDLSLRWQLREIVFSRWEPTLARDQLAREKVAEKGRREVTQLWFKRLQVELRIRKKPSSELLFEAARLDGLIEAITHRDWKRH